MVEMPRAKVEAGDRRVVRVEKVGVEGVAVEGAEGVGGVQRVVEEEGELLPPPYDDSHARCIYLALLSFLHLLLVRSST